MGLKVMPSRNDKTKNKNGEKAVVVGWEKQLENMYNLKKRSILEKKPRRYLGLEYRKSCMRHSYYEIQVRTFWGCCSLEKKIILKKESKRRNERKKRNYFWKKIE